jgi:hypothetical protein
MAIQNGIRIKLYEVEIEWKRNEREKINCR